MMDIFTCRFVVFLSVYICLSVPLSPLGRINVFINARKVRNNRSWRSWRNGCHNNNYPWRQYGRRKAVVFRHICHAISFHFCSSFYRTRRRRRALWSSVNLVQFDWSLASPQRSVGSRAQSVLWMDHLSCCQSVGPQMRSGDCPNYISPVTYISLKSRFQI